MVFSDRRCPINDMKFMITDQTVILLFPRIWNHIIIELSDIFSITSWTNVCVTAYFIVRPRRTFNTFWVSSIVFHFLKWVSCNNVHYHWTWSVFVPLLEWWWSKHTLSVVWSLVLRIVSLPLLSQGVCLGTTCKLQLRLSRGMNWIRGMFVPTFSL